MSQLNSFNGSAPCFWQTNADGTVYMSFPDSGGCQIPWSAFNTGYPPSQIRQPAPSTEEPHGNQEFMNPNHFNGMPIHRPSMSSSQNASPSESGYLRPSQHHNNTFPPRTPHNSPDPPWSREVPSSSSFSTSTSSTSPRNSTPNNASPTMNHGASAIANANANTDTTTSANSSPTGLGSHTHFTRFTCHLCSFSAKTQRDFDRHLTSRAHLRKHGHHDTEETVKRFHCAVRDCRYASNRGFTRMDNLKRHERDKHKLRDTSDAIVGGGQGEGEVEEG